MENDFQAVSSGSRKALSALVSSTFLQQQGGEALENDDDDSEDEEELETFRHAEVKNLFQQVDRDGSNLIDKQEMSSLLSGLGADLPQSELDVGFAKIDTDSSGFICFDEFYAWYKETLIKTRKDDKGGEG